MICRDLLGYDFADAKQREEAFATGKVFELCPGLVLDAIAILEEMFNEDE